MMNFLLNVYVRFKANILVLRDVSFYEFIIDHQNFCQSVLMKVPTLTFSCPLLKSLSPDKFLMDSIHGSLDIYFYIFIQKIYSFNDEGSIIDSLVMSKIRNLFLPSLLLT